MLRACWMLLACTATPKRTAPEWTSIETFTMWITSFLLPSFTPRAYLGGVVRAWKGAAPGVARHVVKGAIRPGKSLEAEVLQLQNCFLVGDRSIEGTPTLR